MCAGRKEEEPKETPCPVGFSLAGIELPGCHERGVHRKATEVTLPFIPRGQCGDTGN
jgi:hypothetical protein